MKPTQELAAEHTAVPGLNPYAVLAREHRLIERALDVLSRICNEARRTKRLNASDATQVIQFLRDFADRTHHVKEEKVLFPAIESRTFFPGCGLVSEHQLGRERVTRMASVVEGASNGDADSVQVFVRQARSLIGLLREHIAKEDDCLANVVHREFSGKDSNASVWSSRRSSVARLASRRSSGMPPSWRLWRRSTAPAARS